MMTGREVLKTVTDPRQDFPPELPELRSAMVDGRPGDGSEHGQRRVRWARNLQEVTAGLDHGGYLKRVKARGSSLEFCMQFVGAKAESCIQFGDNRRHFPLFATVGHVKPCQGGQT